MNRALASSAKPNTHAKAFNTQVNDYLPLAADRPERAA